MIRSARYTSNGSALRRHAQPLARDELEDVAGLDVFLAFDDRGFERFTREVAFEFQRKRRGRVDLTQLAHRRLLEALDDFVSPPARIAIGRVGVAVVGRDVGIGDDLDRFVDVIENDEFVVEPEQDVRNASIVLWRGRELFAFVIANGVIPGVSDQAAGECGEVG